MLSLSHISDDSGSSIGAGSSISGISIKSTKNTFPLSATILPYFQRPHDSLIASTKDGLLFVFDTWTKTDEIISVTPHQVRLVIDTLQFGEYTHNSWIPAFRTSVVREAVTDIYQNHGKEAALEFVQGTLVSVCDAAACNPFDKKLPDAELFIALSVIDQLIKLMSVSADQESPQNLASTLEDWSYRLLANNKGDFATVYTGIIRKFSVLSEELKKLSETFSTRPRSISFSDEETALMLSQRDAFVSILATLKNEQSFLQPIKTAFEGTHKSLFLDLLHHESYEQLSGISRRIKFLIKFIEKAAESDFRNLCIQAYNYNLVFALKECLSAPIPNLTIRETCDVLSKYIADTSISQKDLASQFDIRRNDLHNESLQIFDAWDSLALTIKNSRLNCNFITDSIGDSFESHLELEERTLIIGSVKETRIKSLRAKDKLVSCPVYLVTISGDRYHPTASFTPRYVLPIAIKAALRIQTVGTHLWGRDGAVLATRDLLERELSANNTLKNILIDGLEGTAPFFSGVFVCSHSKPNRGGDPEGGDPEAPTPFAPKGCGNLVLS